MKYIVIILLLFATLRGFSQFDSDYDYISYEYRLKKFHCYEPNYQNNFVIYWYYEPYYVSYQKCNWMIYRESHHIYYPVYYKVYTYQKPTCYKSYSYQKNTHYQPKNQCNSYTHNKNIYSNQPYQPNNYHSGYKSSGTGHTHVPAQQSTPQVIKSSPPMVNKQRR